MDKKAIQNDILLAKDMIEKAGLYLVPEHEFEKLALVAMESYQDYPLHKWFSGGKYNSKLSYIIMKTSLYSMKKIGIIYADSSELNGFAIWLPPGFHGTSPLSFFLYGGLKVIFCAGFEILYKLSKYENFAMSLKKKITGHNDWYAYNLSVLKKSQGKGIATKLFKPMIEFAKLKNCSCYLETNTDSNVPLYEHFGFSLAEKTVIPNTTLSHYGMILYSAPVEKG